MPSYFLDLVEEECVEIQNIFKFSSHDIGGRVKYPMFVLKPNNYGKEDWKWLIACIEKRINCWCNRWISCGGWITLVGVGSYSCLLTPSIIYSNNGPH